MIDLAKNRNRIEVRPIVLPLFEDKTIREHILPSKPTLSFSLWFFQLKDYENGS